MNGKAGDAAHQVRLLSGDTLFLDVGDVFTKGLRIGGGARRFLCLPSVVATRLLNDEGASGPTGDELLLPWSRELLRPVQHRPRDFPRARSYPGGRSFLRVAAKRAPATNALYAGWVAAAYGADRQVVTGDDPAPVVMALVRKAILVAGVRSGRLNVILVVDAGPKSQVLTEIVRRGNQDLMLVARSLRRDRPRRVGVSVRWVLADWAECVGASLPAAFSPAAAGAVLVVDVGYDRTKLAVLSREGCDDQEVRLGLGVGGCVRRILRDGQEQGLFEDELAVMRALEEDSRVLRVAGRRFDVARIVAAARDDVEAELGRVVSHSVVRYCQRTGGACHALALVGGGAALLGAGVVARVTAAQLGIERWWVAPAPRYLVVRGAARTWLSGRWTCGPRS